LATRERTQKQQGLKGGKQTEAGAQVLRKKQDIDRHCPPKADSSKRAQIQSYVSLISVNKHRANDRTRMNQRE
jgi:hypothetical protein